MFENWSDEELLERFGSLATSYKSLADTVLPILSKISVTEKELLLLSKEIDKRGIKIDADTPISG